MKLFGRKSRGGDDGATHDRSSDRTDRAHLEGFRLERQDRRVTQAIAAGTLTATQGAG